MSSGPPAFCSVLARERGLDPVGYAGAVDLYVAFELPLPWPYDLWRSERMPIEIRRVVDAWYRDPDAPRPRLRPLALAPDPDQARPGRRWALVHRRPLGSFARFDAEAWSLPEEAIGPFAWALLMEPERLTDFERYRADGAGDRHLLVCTHGRVDAACARYGVPLQRQLREMAPPGTRVWRTSHFGGHVFAPTLVDLPSGRLWGFLDGDRPARLLRRSGDPDALSGAYRGWSGLDDPFLQAAEREAWQAFGWRWFELPKRGEILDRSEAGDRAEVRLVADTPDGPLDVHVRVESAPPVTTRADTAAQAEHRYRQYRATLLAPSSEPEIAPRGLS